ncbi:nucleotide exchange factor GrpE [Caldisericum exile]|uniref:Protein GrpE n=1 Tax=Caldisericum exile (strain DSM 21853 / NBRC 104410 / AZM16c01) TaxID=511051 RepID=A0A7U6GEG3_CALEA|nr:nucleotide exchange factor GrpE [Caldisericum exile]BAL80817.1 protein GrpE [Caldisericum exile AZM16c01]
MANNEEEKKTTPEVKEDLNEEKRSSLDESSKNQEKTLEEKLKEMEEELKKKESEIFDLKVENIKLKESLRQASDIYEKELKRKLLKERIEIFKEFLEVLDNFERAFESINDDSVHSKGIMLIKEQLMKFLSSYGIKEMDLLNKPYDPNIAEIGEVVATKDHEPNMVVKILRKGYYIGDDVLRTAVVAVSKESTENTSNQNNN